MHDTTIVKKGFGTRLSNSIKSVPIGILFLIIGIVMLGINEKNVVKNEKNVEELRTSYTEISNNLVNNENDGKLIVTSGSLLYSPEVLSDSTFNVKVKTPILERCVEVYEWIEKQDETNGETTYTYEKEWDDALVDSSKFYTKNGHTNPTTMTYNSSTYKTTTLRVGSFALNRDYLELLKVSSELQDLSNVTLPSGYKVVGNYITNATDINNPEVGNIRISFKYGDYNDITVMGKQYGNIIESYTTSKGTSVSRLEKGIMSGEAVINNIVSENNLIKWVLRALGTILIIAGIAAIVSPLTNLTSYVPVLGNLFNSAVGLTSTIVGVALALVVIAISWIIFRPIIGIILLAVVVILIMLLKKISKNQN